MPIEFACPVCDKVLRVPEGTEGQQTRCPKCLAIQTIPNRAEVMAAESASVSLPGREDVPSAVEGENLFAEREIPEEEDDQQAAGPPSLAALRASAEQRLLVPILISRIILWLFFGTSLAVLAVTAVGLVAGAIDGDHAVVPMVLISGLAAIQGLALWGHSHAARQENYLLAWAGLVLAPLGTMCCFALPFAIWGGVVMLDEEVYRAFRG